MRVDDTGPTPCTRIAIIGAPSDVGASARGASMGPEALRIAGLREALECLDLNVEDRGNVQGPANPWLPPVEGYRHLQEVTQWNQEVHDAVHGALTESRLPILLGGDHSLSIGSISAVSRYCRARGKTLRVLWLDAHADFNTGELTPSGNIHGMPVACLCGYGPLPLVEMGGSAPAVHSSELCQIGIRSVDQGEKRLVHQAGHEILDMRAIDELGVRQALAMALQNLDDNTHLHVSFDVDFLDPTIAPGVATTVSGGPSYREAQLCMEMIADTHRLASLDIMELNPAYDANNRTGAVAVDLVASMFGKSTLMRS